MCVCVCGEGGGLTSSYCNGKHLFAFSKDTEAVPGLRNEVKTRARVEQEQNCESGHETSCPGRNELCKTYDGEFNLDSFARVLA